MLEQKPLFKVGDYVRVKEDLAVPDGFNNAAYYEVSCVGEGVFKYVYDINFGGVYTRMYIEDELEALSPKELEEAPEEMHGIDYVLKYGRDDIIDALYADVRSGRLNKLDILMLTEILDSLYT